MDHARDEVHLHDHAVCTYDSTDTLVAALGRFVREGLAKRQTNVFVHSYETEAEAWRLLERAYPGAERLRADELVVVSLYKDAFEGKAGRIDYEHVKGVVTSLVGAAGKAGRQGVRIFVDASKVYLRTRRSDEWFAFESWLGRRLDASVGLVCAYPREEAMRPENLPRVLETHAYRFDATSRRG